MRGPPTACLVLVACIAAVAVRVDPAVAAPRASQLRWTPGPPLAPQRHPSPGAWSQYVLLPRTRSVCPVRVAVPAGAAENPGAVTCSGSGVARIHGSIVLDFGREMSGPLVVQFARGSTPGMVSLAYSETLAYLGSCDSLGVEQFAPPGAIAPCPRTIQVSGAPQRYEDPAARSGFRYVLLRAPGSGRLDLRSARVRYTADPGRLRRPAGWFLSSSDALNQHWYAGTYNAQVNTVATEDVGVAYEGLRDPLPGVTPVMVDGAKRDRYVWYDLAGPKTLLPLLYGDTRTPLNTLETLGSKQDRQGFIPACVLPESFYGASCDATWTDATPWWVIALHEYVQWTGDRAAQRALTPTVIRALDALAQCRTPDGLVAPCHGTVNYLGNSDATPSTYLSAVAYEALIDGADLVRRLRPAVARRLTATARDLARATNQRLWDPQRGAYRQSLAAPRDFPQDANVLAALWGLAGPARAGRALAYVRRHLWTPHGVANGQAGNSALVANWITYFEMEARARRGDLASVRRLIDAAWGFMHLRWKRIAGTNEPPSTTGWEHIQPHGIYRGAESSTAHVWSEGAAIIETTAILGVRPTAPGFRRWQVRPGVRGAAVRWAEGRVPTPRGPILVSWHRDRRLLVVSLRAPRGTRGTVVLPDGSRRSVAGGRRRRIAWRR